MRLYLIYGDRIGFGSVGNENYGFVEAYVVGSFISNEFDAKGQSTKNKTERVY
ncbi:MAG: hypothetical protein ACERKD_03370 [Prolixibacteraceae bacterium]